MLNTFLLFLLHTSSIRVNYSSIDDACFSNQASFSLCFQICDSVQKSFHLTHERFQCRHLIHALNAWAAQTLYNTARPIVTQFPGHGCIDNLKRRGWLMSLDYFFDILSMGVCTTRHWQTSGRLVQKTKVSTVDVPPLHMQWTTGGTAMCTGCLDTTVCNGCI